KAKTVPINLATVQKTDTSNKEANSFECRMNFGLKITVITVNNAEMTITYVTIAGSAPLKESITNSVIILKGILNVAPSYMRNKKIYKQTKKGNSNRINLFL